MHAWHEVVQSPVHTCMGFVRIDSEILQKLKAEENYGRYTVPVQELGHVPIPCKG